MGKFLERLFIASTIFIGLFIFFFIKIIVAFLMIIILFLLIQKVVKIRAKRMYNENLIEKNAQIIEEVEQSRLLDILNLEGFIPSPTEVVFLMQDAEMFTAVLPDKKTGDFESLSVPLPMHFHFNVGRFGIKQRQKYHFGTEGKGRLYLTDNRIVFISEFGNTIIKYDKILNIENLNDGVRIDIEGRKPVKFITGDIRFYVMYKKIEKENRNYEHLKAFSKQRGIK